MPAINNIFKRIDNFTRDELFLYTGLYLGVSTLFYFPSFVFFLSTLLSLILFTSAIPRRLILMALGYFQLLGIAALYYYWHDSGREFYFQFFWSAFALNDVDFLSSLSLIKVGGLLLIFLVVGFFKLYSRNYYVNFQVKFQSVMLITLVAAFLSLFLQPQRSAMHLIAFVPVIAFFLSHLFLLIEKRLKAEILFLLFLVLTFVYQSLLDKDLRWIGQLVDFGPLIVQETDHDLAKDKKILVLGNNVSVYQGAKLATPYFNWPLSRQHLEKMEYYDVVNEVYNNFSRDLPEVIVDLNGVAPILFEKMPTIALRYRRDKGGVYVLREGS